jgi:hypothetical protein
MNAAENNTVSVGQILFAIAYILIFPALILFLSGDWYWLEGWMFAVWFITLSLTSLIYLYRKDQELLAERFKLPGMGNEKVLDRFIIANKSARSLK